MSIQNLTRKILPSRSILAKTNSENLKSMPEMVLSRQIARGNKSIVHVGMNEIKTARIAPEGVNTVYTDALASCNSVGVVMKDKNGKPLVVLSHFLPYSTDRQAVSVGSEIQKNLNIIDLSKRAKIFYNVPGYEDEGVLKPCVNHIFEEIRAVADKIFNKNYEEQVVVYKSKNRSAYFSSANIFQFDTENLNKLKVTTVGEQEHFVDLSI